MRDRFRRMMLMAAATGLVWFLLSQALSLALEVKERHLNLVQGSIEQFYQQAADSAYFNWLGWLIFWVAVIISYSEVGKVRRLDAVFAINVGFLVGNTSFPLRAASGGPLGKAMVIELIDFVLRTLFDYILLILLVCLIWLVIRLCVAWSETKELRKLGGFPIIGWAEGMAAVFVGGEKFRDDFSYEWREVFQKKYERMARFDRARAQREFSRDVWWMVRELLRNRKDLLRDSRFLVRSR